LRVSTLLAAPPIAVCVEFTEPPGAERPLSGTGCGVEAPCARAELAPTSDRSVVIAHTRARKLNAESLVMAECIAPIN
jgi:hypothetical protein